MTKRNLINFVIFSVAVLVTAAAFQIFAGNTASASGDFRADRQKSTSKSKLNTDKALYKKGDSAVIEGSGFRRFEEVAVQIEQYDNLLGQNVLRASWIVFADAKGNFVSNWVVPFDGKFTVKGTGAVTKQQIETVVMASVTPVVVAGNPNCAALNASSDPAFAHITSNFGLKIEPPQNGTFTFTNGAGRELTGGAPSDPSSTLTISNLTDSSFDWSATRAITAVIVKGGPHANVYPYNPFSFGDTGLTTVGNGPDISHIEVCFGSSVTTAARVPISGRVTDAYGNGISRTLITLQNTNTSETRTVLTNPFGYYRFNDLEVGDFYIVTAQSKRYTFEGDSHLFSLSDAMENLDFVASEQ